MPRTVDPESNRSTSRLGPCDLDDAVLARFAAGELDAPFSTAVVEHVRRCTPCGTRVIALRIALRRSAVRDRTDRGKASQARAAAAAAAAPPPQAPAPEPSATIDRPRRFRFSPEGVGLRLESGVGFPAPASPVEAPDRRLQPDRAAPPPVRIEISESTEDDRGPERTEPRNQTTRPDPDPAPRTRMSRRRRLVLAAAPLLAAGATAGGLFAGGLSTGAAPAATHQPPRAATVSPVTNPPMSSSPAPASAR